jgi:hypothetical protein
MTSIVGRVNLKRNRYIQVQLHKKRKLNLLSKDSETACSFILINAKLEGPTRTKAVCILIILTSLAEDICDGAAVVVCSPCESALCGCIACIQYIPIVPLLSSFSSPSPAMRRQTVITLRRNTLIPLSRHAHRLLYAGAFCLSNNRPS